MDEQMTLEMEPLETKKWISKGKCNLCGGNFKKAGMTRHLAACKEKNPLYQTKSEKKTPKTKTFHIMVEGCYLPEYWMHLEVPVQKTLKDLDSFLRRTWLECCGHLSEFRIAEKTYALSPLEELDDENLDIKLKDVLAPGTTFHHYYDFGSTTELTLKVLSEQEVGKKISSIKILARNDLPPIPCGSCFEPATKVCPACSWSEKGWLCNKCALKHKYAPETLLPVVISPRVGVFGYTGRD